MIDLAAMLRQALLSAFAPPARNPWIREFNVQFAVNDLIYENLNPLNLPPVSLQTSTFKNGTSVQDAQTFQVSKKTTDTFSWSLTEAISISYEYTAKVPLVGESTTKIALNFSSTQSQSVAVERQWIYSAQIPVPPHSTVDATFLILEGKITTPFTAAFQAHGHISVDFNIAKPGAPDDWRTISGDIDEMIADHWGFPAKTFLIPVKGTFAGIAGTSYIVQTNEHAQAAGEQVTKELAGGTLLPALSQEYLHRMPKVAAPQVAVVK